ncbi:hypothetical protein BY996DRAFT_6448962 [Phakopsora pachyrhizi]|nr:hypothetical protein BY996DRAFT_6448962 [Phakopsora pachyrhizi]
MPSQESLRQGHNFLLFSRLWNLIEPQGPNLRTSKAKSSMRTQPAPIGAGVHNFLGDSALEQNPYYLVHNISPLRKKILDVTVVGA